MSDAETGVHHKRSGGWVAVRRVIWGLAVAALGIVLVISANIGLSATSAAPKPPESSPDLRPATQSQVTKIMPLGDSITGSPGCWRSLLWNELAANDYEGVDFVGSLKSVPCGKEFDGDHQGIRGLRAADAATNAKFAASFRSYRHDIVLMHFGTNDIWHGDPRAKSILNAYSTLLKQLRAANPKVTLLVSQLIPMKPKGCADCMDNVASLNTRIPDWVRDSGTKQSPVIAVDQWTGFDAVGDTRDGVHPNGSGTKKIAANWMEALRPILDNR